MSQLHRLAGMLALATSLVACSTGPVHVPTVTLTEATPEPGRVASEYPIPPDAPQGSLRIASYGIVEVSPATNPGEHLNAIHLRVAVDNGSEQEWWIDTRQQRVDLEGRGSSAPSFASANPGWPPPLVTVPPKSKRVVDLFYSLPAQLQTATALPRFDALWIVQMPDGATSDRTPFERLRIEPPPIYGVYDYGVNYYWGPPYWCDEDTSRFGFGGTAYVPHRYAKYPLLIHRTSRPPSFLERNGGGSVARR